MKGPIGMFDEKMAVDKAISLPKKLFSDDGREFVVQAWKPLVVLDEYIVIDASFTVWSEGE